jgi:hypothetical protein
MYFDLLALPGLIAVVILVVGGWLTARPRKALTTLSDAFAIGTGRPRRASLGERTARASGIILITYGVFLATNAIHLTLAVVGSH